MNKILSVFLILGVIYVFNPHPTFATTNDAIACWDFNESSGAAADSGPSGYTLTNTNTVAYSAGLLNNAADAGAANTNKKLNTSSFVGLTHNSNYTFNVWVNINAYPANGTEDGILSWADNSTVNGKIFYQLKFYQNVGTNEIYINRNNAVAGNQIGAASGMSTGTWYMLTYTWDGTTQNLYLNGSGTALLTQASSITGSNTSNGMSDGFRYFAESDDTAFFSGMVDVGVVYNRVLTSGEITSLYNSGTGIDCTSILAVAGAAKDNSYTNVQWF